MVRTYDGAQFACLGGSWNIGTTWICEFQMVDGITLRVSIFLNNSQPRRQPNATVKPLIVPEDYPNDNDTNSVAFSILRPVDSKAHAYIDEILACKNEQGIVQVRSLLSSMVCLGLHAFRFILTQTGHELLPRSVLTFWRYSIDIVGVSKCRSRYAVLEMRWLWTNTRNRDTTSFLSRYSSTLGDSCALLQEPPFQQWMRDAYQRNCTHCETIWCGE